MRRQPKLISLKVMRDIFTPHPELLKDRIYIDNQLAIIHGAPDLFKVMIQQQPPFSTDDYRMGFVANGEAHVTLNLVERHISAGMLVFIGPGSVINPIGFSDDFEIYGFGIPTDFPLPFASGQKPSTFNGRARDFTVPATPSQIATACHILDTMWHVVHQENYNKAVVANLIAAQMHHYDSVYGEYADSHRDTLSREQTIFDRFIYLVNQHATREHRMGFYASKMCLTDSYLSTVVRQASGTTAKEWIDRALITRIKAELRHTDKPVAQIADEMNFANASFFSKYFKRLTGVTPGEFREQ